MLSLCPRTRSSRRLVRYVLRHAPNTTTKLQELLTLLRMYVCSLCSVYAFFCVCDVFFRTSLAHFFAPHNRQRTGEQNKNGTTKFNELPGRTGGVFRSLDGSFLGGIVGWVIVCRFGTVYGARIRQTNHYQQQQARNPRQVGRVSAYSWLVVASPPKRTSWHDQYRVLINGF